MNTRIFKITAFLLAFAGSFSSCSKDGGKDWLSIAFSVVHDESTSIVGKWKLEKVIQVFAERKTYDYSRHNIVYEFYEDNILKVSGNTKHGRCLSNGTYPYSIDVHEGGATLKLHGLSTGCAFNSKELAFSYCHLDGDTYYFTRITPKK